MNAEETSGNRRRSDPLRRKSRVKDSREGVGSFRELYEEVPAAYHEIDLEGRITRMNSAELEMLGYEAEEMLGRGVWEFVQEPDGAFASATARIEDSRLMTPRERTLIKKDGTRIPALLQEQHILDNEGRVIGIRAVILDISERKSVESQLAHAASHDSLTGLLNRASFYRIVAGRLADHIKLRKNSLFAVLYLDLDHFKKVNDNFGHSIGDQLLVAISQLLRASLRPEDTVARLGGDEFAILLADIRDARDSMRVADRLGSKLSLPLALSGKQVSVGASIGIALSVAGYQRAEDILRDADAAMYRAKAEGGGSYKLFDPGLHAQAVALLQLENDLRRAVQQDEFRIHYQPIVLVRNEKITGFEALVRWQHPVRGLVYPAEFIPIAEETGLIVPIGCWVLREACRQMKAWQQQFPSVPALYVSVNLSVRQFMEQDLIEQIDSILEETGLDGGSLRLEITESMILEHAQATVTSLMRLKARRIHLYIDDFGTGYSSLSHLHRFPIDTLKIDRSFIRELGVSGQDPRTIRAILGLASNFNLGVTVEGVETEEQLAQLRTLECTEAQGYFFSEPVDRTAAETLITAQAHL